MVHSNGYYPDCGRTRHQHCQCLIRQFLSSALSAIMLWFGLPASVECQDFKVAVNSDSLKIASSEVQRIDSLASRVSMIGEGYRRLSKYLSGNFRGIALSDSIGTQAPPSEIYSKNAPSIVLLIAPNLQSFGSGVFISEDGEILTAHHVVSGSDQFFVVFYDSALSIVDQASTNEYRVATLMAVDPKRDLALLRLGNRRTSAFVKFGKDSEIRPGGQVYAIGHPIGLTWTISSGIIGKLHREYSWSYGDVGDELKADLIQTQLMIWQGNSGGGLFDEKGRLVGIAAFVPKTEPEFNFFVKVNEIDDFVKGAHSGLYAFRGPLSLEPWHFPLSSWFEIDANGNGIPDRWEADRNYDGAIDVRGVDADENGAIDSYAFDNDYDGVFEMSSHDENNDGEPDFWLLDIDGDGQPDIKELDEDNDGLPDKVLEL